MAAEGPRVFRVGIGSQSLPSSTTVLLRVYDEYWSMTGFFDSGHPLALLGNGSNRHRLSGLTLDKIPHAGKWLLLLSLV